MRGIKDRMKQFFQSVFLLSMMMTACEVSADTSLTYEYDANGNLISGDGKYYEYNDANKLVKVWHGDQNGPVIAEYVYDHTGQRIKKIENGVTTYYIGKHYETQVSGPTQANTSYYFANGERVAKKDALGNMFYYHADHLGGTNAISDSSGAVIERTRYYPFGEIRLGGSDRYLYTGKEKDKLTDWYYYEARHYNSDFKHFTQADTVEPDYYDPQDLNRYAYVKNNPLTLIDPDGHRARRKDDRSAGKLAVRKIAEDSTIEIAKDTISKRGGKAWGRMFGRTFKILEYLDYVEYVADIGVQWNKPLRDAYRFDRMRGGKSFLKDFFSFNKHSKATDRNALSGTRQVKDPILDNIQGNISTGQVFYLHMRSANW